MNSKAIFIIGLITVILFSLNFVVAAEISDNSFNMSNVDEYELNSVMSDNNLEIEEYGEFLNSNINSEDNPLGVDDVSNTSKVIYVGHHNTTLYGNGSYENPFSNFKSACDSVNGEKNVTLNIFGGTYYMGENLGHQEFLKFNTSNLNIIGINGTVIITYLHNEKIEYTDVQTTYAEAFELASADANITISNIIFNATGCVRTALLLEGNYDYFFPFYGKTNLAVFNNCSFIGFDVPRITGAGYNSKFIKCYFNIVGSFLFYDQFAKNTYHIFEYCIFDKDVQYLKKINLPCEITIDNCWFGQNSLPRFITPPKAQVMQNGKQVSGYVIPVSRYAVLSVSYNYLGDNRFEIAGQFTWNGTNDTEGMENFQPMDVIFETTTGSVNKTVTLVNGSFSTIYTSNSNENELFVTLINEEFNFKFNTTYVVIDAPSIYYGEDQNITLNFSQIVNSTVNITVNNKTYSVKVNESDSFTYTIEDVLTEGNYVVDVVLIDDENHVFGSNSTVLSVSKVSNYDWDYSIPTEAVYGQNITITITLPKDAAGNITVLVGNETKVSPANQTVTVTFNNLNATTYPVTISYNGGDKYVAKQFTDSLTVEKADSKSNVIIEKCVFTYGEVIAIPFNVTNASGINVRVLNKDDVEVANTTSEGSEFTLDILPAGKYTLEATTLVGSNYNGVVKTFNLTINKANSSLNIPDKEFTYATEAIITVVTENSIGDVIATLTDENNTKIEVTVSGESIILPKLNAGKYTLTVTTNPDENHTNTTKSATITITKTIPSMNVIVDPAENITANDNVTLTIKLPTDATGNVVVKINGKQLNTMDTNETITVKLNNQPGEYIADITYSGDNNYESDSTTQQYTIKKAETSITAKQTPSEEGTATIEANITDVDSGIILVGVDGKKFYGDINNGKATVNIEGIPKGNYTANIKFSGNEKYNPTTTTANIKIAEEKIITELKEQLGEANAKVDDLTAELNESQANASKLSDDLADANAKVDDLTGELANATDKITDLTDDLADANAKVDDLVVELNETQANASKLSDDLADANTKVDDLTAELNETQANATKLSENLIAANQTIDDLLKQLEEAKSNATNVTVPETVVVDGVEYPIEYVNGTATVETNKTEPVVVKSSEFGEITISDDQSISIVLKDSDGNVIADAPITYTVNGAAQSTTTDKDGKFTVKGENGTVITINYAGNDNITGTNTTLKLNNAAVPEVVKVAAQFNISDRAITLNGYAVDGPAGEQGIYYATTLLDTNGKPISNAYIEFAVNNKIYNRTTLENGSFNPYKLNMVRAGRYTMAFNFAGDDNYTNAFACVCVDLDKKPLTIKAPAKTYKAAAKTKKYTATLSTIPSVHDGKVYLSPKTVKLTVNGKTFTGKTNDKGQVTFKINNLNKKGKYTATISYKGDKTYEEATQKVKLTIK